MLNGWIEIPPIGLECGRDKYLPSPSSFSGSIFQQPTIPYLLPTATILISQFGGGEKFHHHYPSRDNSGYILLFQGKVVTSLL
ncbi:hypothetical protein NL676_036281 [Syzygium grande]|nr:hypothetical protein NL676_036281 [Syzygium grande]